MTARTRGPELRATTILAVRHRGRVVVAGDGQVTIGNTIMKSNARKLRRLYQDRVLAGFAGAGADALTLFERFEAKLQQVSGNLRRAAVDLAKAWGAAPPAGSPARDRRPRVVARRVGHRRRDRARGRPLRHRLGRQLRAGRGARAGEALPARRAPDRRGGAAGGGG